VGECYVKSMELYDIGLSIWGLMVWRVLGCEEGTKKWMKSKR
jgi:hypothetical protein